MAGLIEGIDRVIRTAEMALPRFNPVKEVWKGEVQPLDEATAKKVEVGVSAALKEETKKKFLEQHPFLQMAEGSLAFVDMVGSRGHIENSSFDPDPIPEVGVMTSSVRLDLLEDHVNRAVYSSTTSGPNYFSQGYELGDGKYVLANYEGAWRSPKEAENSDPSVKADAVVVVENGNPAHNNPRIRFWATKEFLENIKE